jgi:D-3-phosphoglycerate dehydrogenase
MKVLVNDGMADEGVQVFKDSGFEVDTEHRDLGKLVDEAGGFEAITVRNKTKVTREVLEAGYAGNLQVVGRAGVGTDNIDLDAANDNRVLVKFAPHGNTNAAAEQALGLMLAVSRNIPQAHVDMIDGVWNKARYKGTEVSHKTLGIIGCGRIGQRLANLVSGFGMEVVGYDIQPQPDSPIKYLPLDEVLRSSDYISLHVGGKDVLIGPDQLEMMKPTSYLINTSRGVNVDPEALYRALKEGQIAGAGLDVHAGEPKEGNVYESGFIGLPNVVLTPHLGASTKEAQILTSIEMAESVVNYLLRGKFDNSVNARQAVDNEQKQVFPLYVQHRDEPGAFANIARVLADNDINIRENPSRQLGPDSTVTTVYLVHQHISQKVLGSLEALPIVYRARANGHASGPS